MMIPLLSRTLVATLLAVTTLVGHAQAPQAPEVAANAYLLMDVSAGQVLAAINVSGQANRTNARAMQADILPPLLAAARRISGLLAGR